MKQATFASKDGLEPVFQSHSADEAQLIASFLRSNGFECFVFGEPLRIVGYPMYGALVPIRVLVRAENAQRARDLLLSEIKWMKPTHQPRLSNPSVPDRTLAILLFTLLAFIVWYFLSQRSP
ncbi:MAG: putative signal transducing protein [bacterium]